MFRTPEAHAANPPSTWQVSKAGDRRWQLLIAGNVLDTFRTKTEAQEAKTAGRWVQLYEDEDRWFAGESVRGWKPYRKPERT